MKNAMMKKDKKRRRKLKWKPASLGKKRTGCKLPAGSKGSLWRCPTVPKTWGSWCCDWWCFLWSRDTISSILTTGDAPAPKLNGSSCCLHILPALPLLTWLLPSFQEAARALPASQRHHLITFILAPHPEPLYAACWVVLCHLDTG